MLESKEFASAYAEVVERRIPQKKLINSPASDEEEESKAEFYGETTEAFKSALSKIPDSLLHLLDSQFHAKPTVLVAGGIVPDAYESSTADAGEASENAAQANQFIEEEEEQD